MVQNVDDVVKIAGQTVERSTLAGLKSASAKSGVSFQYLVAKAAQESSLQTDARATTSTAKGLFQFTQGTWLDMMQRHGAHYGYGELTSKISVGVDGKTTVSDSAAERRLLDLRQDPEASALMAAEYARANAESLEGALGRGPDAPDLYLAHFLGATGASRLLNAAENAPETIAAKMLPAAANANQSVFYTADGRARTAAEVASLVRERFSDQMDRYADASSVMADQSPRQISVNARATSKPDSDFNVLDFKTNLNGSNTYAMAVSWAVLEEMANLISSSPMAMIDGSENEEDGDKDPFATSAPGFQGQDFAAALMQSIRSSAESHREPQQTAAPDHQRTAAAYEERYQPVGAPRVQTGKDSDRVG
jgi:hypothetical protein